jgi:hypothetical protein
LADAAPVLLLIALGVVVRQSGLIDEKAGLALTRLAYHVTIPAAILASIARSRFEPSLLWLPVIGLVAPIALAGLIYLSTPHLAAQPARRGVMMSAMVVLGIFGYPFAELFFGKAGLARMALFDVGNAIFAGTVALWIAQSYGSRTEGARVQWGQALARLGKSPLVWASVLGIVLSVSSWGLEGPLASLVDRLAAANTPLAMIAVGVFLRPRASQVGLVAHYVFVRLALGGLLAWAIGAVLHLPALDRVIAVMGCTLPTGTTALVYAGNEGLDAELAAALVSVTVLIGAVVISILPHLLARAYL